MRSAPSEHPIDWPPSTPIIEASRPAVTAGSTSSAVRARPRAVRVAREQPVEPVDLLERLRHGLVRRQVGRHVDRPELAADAAGAQPRKIGHERRHARRDVGLGVVGRLEARAPQRPQQIVVPVDQWCGAQQVERASTIARHAASRLPLGPGRLLAVVVHELDERRLVVREADERAHGAVAVEQAHHRGAIGGEARAGSGPSRAGRTAPSSGCPVRPGGSGGGARRPRPRSPSSARRPGSDRTSRASGRSCPRTRGRPIRRTPGPSWRGSCRSRRRSRCRPSRRPGRRTGRARHRSDRASTGTAAGRARSRAAGERDPVRRRSPAPRSARRVSSCRRRRGGEGEGSASRSTSSRSRHVRLKEAPRSKSERPPEPEDPSDLSTCLYTRPIRAVKGVRRHSCLASARDQGIPINSAVARRPARRSRSPATTSVIGWRFLAAARRGIRWYTCSGRCSAPQSRSRARRRRRALSVPGQPRRRRL